MFLVWKIHEQHFGYMVELQGFIRVFWERDPEFKWGKIIDIIGKIGNFHNFELL